MCSRGIATLARLISAAALAGVIAITGGPASASATHLGASPAAILTSLPTPTPPIWQTAWTAPMDFFDGVAVNATARDIAPVAVAGTSVEVQLSNQWSTTPSTFGSVTVAVEQSGPSVVTGSTTPVTFNHGSPEVTVPPGQDATSDPIPFVVRAGESLAISMWVQGSATVSIHDCCFGHIDSYATPNGAGNQTANESGSSFTIADDHTRWLSAIEVSGSPFAGTVVAFGDSITDGFNDAGYSWTTPLQQRIGFLPAPEQVSVVNEGITGNTITAFPSPSMTYELTSGGQPGVTRLARDALSLPGVRSIVLFLGTNDIWFGGRLPAGSPYGSAASIIAAMQSVISQAHASDIKVFGVTLLPRTSSPPPDVEDWTDADQSNLEQVNAWIRSPQSGFDGVIDLSAVVSDVYNGQCDPNALFGPYNSGDNLHPSAAGQLAMADAIPTTLFGLPEAPQIPQAVTAVPTPGCPGAALAAQALALAQAAPSAPTTTTTTTAPVRTHRVLHPVSRRSSSITPTVVAILAIAVLALVLWTLLRRRAIHRRRLRRERRRNAPPTSTAPPPPSVRL